MFFLPVIFFCPELQLGPVGHEVNDDPMSPWVQRRKMKTSRSFGVAFLEDLICNWLFIIRRDDWTLQWKGLNLHDAGVFFSGPLREILEKKKGKP